MSRCWHRPAPAAKRPRREEGWSDGVGNYRKWLPLTPTLSSIGIPMGPPRGSESCTECLASPGSVKWKPVTRPKAL